MISQVTEKQNDIFCPSGLNSDFAFTNLTFAEYVLRMREIIEQTRVDLNTTEAELIIDANSPYEWSPPSAEARNPLTGRIKNGILLLHGLFDSPCTLNSIAQYYMQKNFLVRTILLPGHGTVPGDLLQVSYHSWLKATEFGIKSFNHEVDNLFVGGFSTGATLALCSAYYYNQIKGVLLFAPAIKLQTQVALISSINHLMTRTIGGMKWYSQNIYNDYAKYHSFTLDSARQVQLLTKIVSQLHSKQSLTTPLFIAMSADDEVISTTAVVNFFNSLNHPENSLYIYGKTPEKFTNPNIIWLPSHYPEANIIDFSHICITIAPDHPHYGMHGDFPDFQHYSRIYGRYYAKNNYKPEIYKGAISYKNLKKYHLMRLTYNPDFYPMMERIDNFMNRILQLEKPE
jgi:esterase/lipase